MSESFIFYLQWQQLALAFIFLLESWGCQLNAEKPLDLNRRCLQHWSWHYRSSQTSPSLFCNLRFDFHF